MKKIIIGSLLGGLAGFFWGFIYWGLSPMGHWGMEPLPNESALESLIASDVKADGVYFLPRWPERDVTKEQQDAFAKRMQTGPNAILTVRKQPGEGMMAEMMGLGLLVMIAQGAMIAIVLHLGRSAFACYGCRFGVASAIGGFAALSGPATSYVWWFSSCGWTLNGIVGAITTTCAIGAVVAAFVKPDAAPKLAE
jgi:hypothetical protein